MKAFNKLLILLVFVSLFSFYFQNVNAQNRIPVIQGNSEVNCGGSESYEIVFVDNIPVDSPDGIGANQKVLTKNAKSIESAGPQTIEPPATTYQWAVKGGRIISEEGGRVTVQFKSLTGTLSATVTYIDNNRAFIREISMVINVITVTPSPAGIITGSDNICAGTSGVIYSVSPIANAIEYAWSLPSGATIVSGVNTNSITVNYSSSSVSGVISVSGINCTQNGTASSKLITINPVPAQAGSIVGNSTVCPGANGIVYSVTPINGATGYIWTLPTGITGTSTTNSISVNIGNNAVSGNICVRGTNGCGAGSPSNLLVSVGTPSNVGIITGLSAVKAGTNGVAYSIPNIAGTNYTWELPSGATIASGANTNSITVNYATNATSGIIKVTPVNGCGSGASSNMAVAVGDISATGSLTVNPLEASNSSLKFKANGTNLGIIGSDASINSGGVAANLGMAVYGNNKLEFSTNSAKRLVIDGVGNVGIGTTIPFAGLTINKGGDAAPFLGIGSSAWGWQLYERAADGDILFKTSNNSVIKDVLTLRRANGNIGIGTTSPSYPLTVEAPKIDNSYTTLANFYSGGSYGGGSRIGISSNTTTWVETNSGYSASGQRAGSSYFDSNIANSETGGVYGAINFYTNDLHRLVIKPNGNVGIGTTNPATKLSVNGTITAKEVNITLDGWADFVFHPTYQLRTLGEVEQFIKANSHLPEIPTEAEVKENGVGLGEMNAKLLQKVEELTLYMIEMQKLVTAQQKQMEDQQKQINALKGQTPSNNTPAAK